MTTTVKVTAHCNAKREARVFINGGDDKTDWVLAKTLKDGESYETVVHDSQSVCVDERDSEE